MKEWLQDPKLLWMIGLTLFGVVVAGVRWWFNHSHRHTRLDELIVEIKTDLKEFKADVKSDINDLKADVKALLGREQAISDADSPQHLNELGRSVSSYVNAKAIAEQEAPKVVDRLPSRNPYDIQSYCRRYFAKDGAFEPSAEQLDTFKRCAYDHGIGLAKVRHVCAFELRDEVQRLIAESHPSAATAGTA